MGGLALFIVSERFDPFSTAKRIFSIILKCFMNNLVMLMAEEEFS